MVSLDSGLQWSSLFPRRTIVGFAMVYQPEWYGTSLHGWSLKNSKHVHSVQIWMNQMAHAEWGSTTCHIQMAIETSEMKRLSSQSEGTLFNTRRMKVTLILHLYGQSFKTTSRFWGQRNAKGNATILKVNKTLPMWHLGGLESASNPKANSFYTKSAWLSQSPAEKKKRLRNDNLRWKGWVGVWISIEFEPLD